MGIFYRIVLCTVVLFTWSLAELELGGKYENTLTEMDLYSGHALLDKNLLRLNLFAQSGENLSFRGALQAEAYYGKTQYVLSDYLPKDSFFRQLLRWAAPETLQQNDTLQLERAELTWQKRRSIISVGLQPIQFGPSYIWNPTDIWGKKDPLDPTYERKSSMVLRLEQGLGPWSFTAVAGIEEQLQQTPWTIQAKVFWLGWDLALMGTADSLDTWGLGAWINGQIGDLGTYAEVHRDQMDRGIEEQGNQRWQGVIGCDYTIAIGNGLTMMAEFLYDQTAYRSTNYRLKDWLEYYEGNRLTLSRENLFLSLGYSFEMVTIQANAFLAPRDKSAMLNPWLTYNASDDLQLDFMAGLPIGDLGTLYGTGIATFILRGTMHF